jgi:ABC-type multidrug transport system fused ATPase/permease subunit
MISHRISTVKDADHILVLKDGAVEQYGTHEMLMKQHGSYQRMYQKQLLEEELNVL